MIDFFKGSPLKVKVAAVTIASFVGWLLYCCSLVNPLFLALLSLWLIVPWAGMTLLNWESDRYLFKIKKKE